MTNSRISPIEINKEDFRKMGFSLIDAIAQCIDAIDEKPVTTGESPSQIEKLLGSSSLPENGRDASTLLSETTELVMNHSLLNGHSKFLSYITSSAAPIGTLADLLAATINPNVGANILRPMATAIEKQTIKWLAEFIGVSAN